MRVRGFSGAFDFAGFDFADALGARAGLSASAALRASRGTSLWAAAGGPGWPLGMKRETQSRASWGRSSEGRVGSATLAGRNGGRSESEDLPQEARDWVSRLLGQVLGGPGGERDARGPPRTCPR